MWRVLDLRTLCVHFVTRMPLLCPAAGVLIVNQPEDQFVSVNGTLLLTFNVLSTRPISYQWSKGGQQLEDDGRVSGSNASVLMVDPVEGDDFGGYQCNASNDVDQVLSEVAVVTGEGSGGCCHSIGANPAQAAVALLMCR